MKANEVTPEKWRQDTNYPIRILYDASNPLLRKPQNVSGKLLRSFQKNIYL